MTTKLQIPMDKEVRDALEIRAKSLGFDSAQAYIRVWAKAEVDGRSLNFGDDWGQPSETAATRLNQAAGDAKKGVGLSEPFDNAEDFMKALNA